MKRRYEIRQHDKEDCAAACLASVASFYGLEMPIVRIRDICGTTREGTSLKGIVDAAGKLGLSAKAMKSPEKEIESLAGIGKPVILHVRMESGWLHFIVLYELTGRKAVYMDPGKGELVKVSTQELKEIWTGYLVLLSPLPDFTPGDRKSNLFLAMKGLFLLQRKELLYALSGSVVYIIVGLSTSVFLQQIIDRVLPARETGLLIGFAAVMACLLVLSLFIGYFRNMLTLRAGIQIDGKLVISYLGHLFRLPAAFFMNRGAGELNARIGDAYRIRSFISIRLTIMLISIVSLTVSFLLLFTYYWKLAAITLVSVPLYGLLYYLSRKISKRLNRDIIEASAKFEETNIENLSAIHTVKYFGAYERFLKKAEERYTDLCRKIYKGGRCMTLISSCSEGITKSLTLTILIAGSLFFFRSELSIGELVSFYSVIGFFSSPIMALVESSDEISEAQVSASRLFEIMDYPIEEDEKGVSSPEGLEGNISLRGIYYSYPGQMELIQGLNGSIRSGEITVITGDNGCGKSTLAALLMKVYRPEKGSIEVDGVDLNYLSTEAWRRYIATAPQHPDIFNGTLLENLVPDEETPDLRKVLSLCREAGLEDLLRGKSAGLLARVGENGRMLSGGEKQKIAIVRALYRDPSVFLLDEALSALDRDSRKKIYGLLKTQARKGKSVILISHDRECEKWADRIIDMNSNAHSRVVDYAPVLPVV